MLKFCFDPAGTFNNDKFNDLADEFNSVIYTYVNEYVLPGGDADDLYQCGLIGLYKAVLNYEENGRYSFEYIAEINIKNMIRTSGNRANRKKYLSKRHTRLLSCVNSNSESNNNNEDLNSLFVENRMQDPLEIVIGQENIRSIKGMIDNYLSDNERRVMLLRMAGYKQRHIAKRLQFHPKAVDNALQRARRKLFDSIYVSK